MATETFSRLSYAHVEFPDDTWGWAIVRGYRGDQDYDELVIAFHEPVTDVEVVRTLIAALERMGPPRNLTPAALLIDSLCEDIDALKEENVRLKLQIAAATKEHKCSECDATISYKWNNGNPDWFVTEAGNGLGTCGCGGGFACVLCGDPRVVREKSGLLPCGCEGAYSICGKCGQSV